MEFPIVPCSVTGHHSVESGPVSTPPIQHLCTWVRCPSAFSMPKRLSSQPVLLHQDALVALLDSPSLVLVPRAEPTTPAVASQGSVEGTPCSLCWQCSSRDSLLHHGGTLMACAQLGVHQHTQVRFWQGAFQLGSPQNKLVPVVVTPQGRMGIPLC